MVNDNVLFQVWNQLISFSSVNGWLAFAKVDQLICHFRKTIEGTSAATVKILLKTTKKKRKSSENYLQSWKRSTMASSNQLVSMEDMTIQICLFSTGQWNSFEVTEDELKSAATTTFDSVSNENGRSEGNTLCWYQQSPPSHSVGFYSLFRLICLLLSRLSGCWNSVLSSTSGKRTSLRARK